MLPALPVARTPPHDRRPHGPQHPASLPTQHNDPSLPSPCSMLHAARGILHAACGILHTIMLCVLHAACGVVCMLRVHATPCGAASGVLWCGVVWCACCVCGVHVAYIVVAVHRQQQELVALALRVGDVRGSTHGGLADGEGVSDGAADRQSEVQGPAGVG